MPSYISLPRMTKLMDPETQQPILDEKTGKPKMIQVMRHRKNGPPVGMTDWFLDPEYHRIGVPRRVYKELRKRGRKAKWNPAQIEPMQLDDGRYVTISKNEKFRYVRPTEAKAMGKQAFQEVSEALDGVGAPGDPENEEEALQSILSASVKEQLDLVKTGGADPFLAVLAKSKRTDEKIKNAVVDRAQALADEMKAAQIHQGILSGEIQEPVTKGPRKNKRLKPGDEDGLNAEASQEAREEEKADGVESKSTAKPMTRPKKKKGK